MNEFKVIEIMNKSQISVLKEKNKDYSLNQKIQEYLKDETIFFRISPQNAYKILDAVGVRKDSIEDVYQKLIDPNVFFELVQKGKIKTEDKSIIVKYDKYRSRWII